MGKGNGEDTRLAVVEIPVDKARAYANTLRTILASRHAPSAFGLVEQGTLRDLERLLKDAVK